MYDWNHCHVKTGAVSLFPRIVATRSNYRVVCDCMCISFCKHFIWGKILVVSLARVSEWFNLILEVNLVITSCNTGAANGKLSARYYRLNCKLTLESWFDLLSQGLRTPWESKQLFIPQWVTLLSSSSIRTAPGGLGCKTLWESWCYPLGSFLDVRGLLGFFTPSPFRHQLTKMSTRAVHWVRPFTVHSLGLSPEAKFLASSISLSLLSGPLEDLDANGIKWPAKSFIFW